MLVECDVNAGATFCGTWFWNGDNYDATWENGAIGQMTVVDPNPNSLVISRVDSGGVVAGLTAQYKGKWDGKQVTDGIVPWTWRGTSGTSTWIAFQVTTPVSCVVHGYIQNFYTSPLTAWILTPDPRPDGTRATFPGQNNDLLMIWERPFVIRPFKRAEDEGCFHASADNIPSRITAAIFVDGAAFGDRKEIDAIMAERVKAVNQFTEVMNRVCALGQQGLSLVQIRATLQQEHLQGPAQTQVDKYFGIPVLRPPETPTMRIASTVERLRQTRALLSAPVRDAQGHLYIESTPTAACDLH